MKTNQPNTQQTESTNYDLTPKQQAMAKNIETMKELGFDILVSTYGYTVLKDGVKLHYVSWHTPLCDLKELITKHVIPYYEKRAYEKGQNDLRKAFKKLLDIN